MKILLFILLLAISVLVLACTFIGDIFSEVADTPINVASETPPDRIPTPKPSETQPSTSSPSPNLSDVCILYPNGNSIWLKEGDYAPIEIAETDYEASNASCPPETLLPQVEVNVADLGDPEIIEMKNLIPHLCRQHPARAEIWFNTELPLDYGKYYQSDLWRFNVEDGSVEQVLQDKQGGQFISFSPDGQYLVMAGSQNLRIMNSDGSELRQLFDFPEISICSEVNVWVSPWWYPDSSGVILNVQPGCLNDPDSWSFGLWWIPMMGEAVSIDPFTVEIGNYSLMDPSTQPRDLDSERYVFLENGSLYLSQDGYQPTRLVTLENPDEGHSVFLCPSRD